MLATGESKFTVFGMDEKESRRVVVVQPEKKLFASILLKPGATETITLRPTQPVRGTFTDTDGKPLAGVTVTVDFDGQRYGDALSKHAKFKMKATTDAAGKFELPEVPTAAEFMFSISKGDTRFGGVPKIGKRTVEPGKPLDPFV